ncbi:HAMP domain-containing methyl-accepting chemotaxis protein [Leptospira yasudae]|uniref:Methyl-accepting chemotaxis protein n=1 Tax=Leptospira yasudae TaxID=2202201 RepID=A0A6N4QQB8_9LEPT|nr:methyl-accepting chemotaxis protein [Leptospira yasudae]TGL81420.1 methyl-accepting chemotaxis protein [Leptospira yasudae]TGL81736.1 methyl-accepting chemotaxis protein [Leptospira yasudae]TGL88112.1 methyl-accepting chemotaxis protein [Leptospira yasudae]
MLEAIRLFIQRLKIRNKLRILFLTVGIPILFLIGMSLKNMNDRIYDIETIYEDRVIPLKQLKRISDLYAIDIVDCIHRVNSGEYTYETGISKIDGANKGISQEWEAYLATHLLPEEEEIIEQLKPLFSKSNEEIERAKRFMLAQDAASLNTFAKSTLYSKIDPVTERIEKLIQVQLKITDSIYQSAEKAYTFNFILFGVISGLVFIYSIIIINLFSKNLEKGLHFLNNNIRNADFSHEIEIEEDPLKKDELYILLTTFRDFQMKIKNMLVTISNFSENIVLSGDQLSKSSEHLSSNAQSESASVEEISASIEEISSGMQHVTSNAESQYETLSSFSEEMKELDALINAVGFAVQSSLQKISGMYSEVDEGKNTMSELSQSMRRIEQGSVEMKSITAIIKEISEKVNLLALNAAIEAARAGEHGRGFAVVASEITKLADQTDTSTKTIEDLIRTSNAEIISGKGLVENSVSVYKGILDGLEKLKESSDLIVNTMQSQQQKKEKIRNGLSVVDAKSAEIRNSVQEQKIAISETANAVSNISVTVQNSAANSEEIAASSVSLLQIAKNLQETISFMKG